MTQTETAAPGGGDGGAPAWWESLYDELLAELLLDGADPAEAARTRSLLVRELGLRAGDRVFDQGCGTGRLSLALLEAGLQVWGLDAIPAYVDKARAAAAPWGEAAAFEVGDMHEVRAPAPCQAVVSWWTCLGYYLEDGRNRLPLEQALASLVPGGALAVDTMNVAQVLRGFRPVERHLLQRPEGEAVLLRESRLDLAAGVIHKTWTWTLATGEVRVRPSSVRLYLPHEWARLAREAGFAEVRFVGDLDGSPLTEDSPRCILLARRPA